MELSAGVAPRFKTENRKLHNGLETVDITYLDGWFRGLEYIRQGDTSPLQWEYKGLLSEDAGYTEEEWWRVVDVDPVDFRENGVTLRVTLLSPGKCVEEGLEVTPTEWETFRVTRDKLRSGKENMERELEIRAM